MVDVLPGVPQAFPSGDSGDYPGMTLRDYIAAQCINGMLAAATSWRSSTPTQWAEVAYQIADAMLIEREKPVT